MLLQMTSFRAIFQPKTKKTVNILNHLAVLGQQVHKKVCGKNVKERNRQEDLSVDGRKY